MSKLDNIIIEACIKVIDRDAETLGDYVDPAKQKIKALMLEIISETDFAYKDARAYSEVLRKKVEEL